MKVWWVLGSDQYYPSLDNFCASFLTKEEADQWVWNEQNHDHSLDFYRVINISNRL